MHQNKYDPISPYQLGTTNHSQILTCNWFDNPEKSGIPNTLVTKVYNDHNQLQIKNTLQLNDLLKVVSTRRRAPALCLPCY